MTTPRTLHRHTITVLIGALLGLGWPISAEAQVNATAAPATCAGGGECLCDNSYQDCRSAVLKLINNETKGIDVSIWFMTDWRYAAALVNRWQAGVPVRVILDLKGDMYNGNKAARDRLVAGGIPIRKYRGSWINHWKMMLFAGQGKVQFSAANYADGSFSPSPMTAAYTNYVDEAIYFTDDDVIVRSFMKKFDDQWMDNSTFVNYANITTPLTRRYDTYPVSTDLNFAPDEHYENRAVGQIKFENAAIDAVMFRITSSTVPDALIARKTAGVPVRLITEKRQYRLPGKFWHAYNVDRMYMAGIDIKVKDNVSGQDVHQKSILLHTRGLAPAPQPMVIFGSSNWTLSASVQQEEHNYFTTKPWMVEWFTEQFERKWDNKMEDGTPIGKNVYIPFTPLAPEAPVNVSPASASVGLGTSVTLKWEGGYYAFRYDIYLDTTPTFTKPFTIDYTPSLATAGVVSTKEWYSIAGLQPGTTYYWKIVGKTMADKTKTGPTWSFTTSGSAPPPPTKATLDPADILILGMNGLITGTAWTKVSDATAAGGQRLWNPNNNAAKILSPAANPASYVEFTFNAVAGQAYRLWIRGRAENDYYGNDSAFLQFSGAVNASGVAIYRIDTTSATDYNLEDCSGCGLAAWGWQDNAYEVGVTPAPIYFATTGPQTLRIQQREDGVSIDQIILSPTTFRTTAPGLLTNDTTIYP